jgi:hypothetical protein
MRRLIALFLTSSWLLPATAGPYAESGPAVIQIHIEGILNELPAGAKTKNYQDDATGFIVSPDGLVMTAGHVVPDQHDFVHGTLVIEGRFAQPIPHGLQAADPPSTLSIVRGTTTPYDIGLFKVEDIKKPLRFLRLCDDYEVEENLTFLGYLGGQRPLTSRGAKVARPSVNYDPILMQVPMSKADSGGPFINVKGGVVAVGIGQLQINDERVAQMNFAVWIHDAITAMTPETLVLFGTSYDPQCDKKLENPAASDSGTVSVNQTTGVTLGSGQTKVLTQTFQAPEGNVFSEIVGTDVTSDTGQISARPSSSTISNGGKTLQMTVQANANIENGGFFNSIGKTLGWTTERVASGSIAGKVFAKVKALPNNAVVASSNLEPQPRSILVSKTLDTHASTTTRQKFSEQIPAPAGYRFQQVIGVNVASMSHSPSNGLEASVDGEGNFIRATYSLESGPLENPWKAWIDAFITATLIPAERK